MKEKIKWDWWIKEIWWTYWILRKSDLFFYLLPGFYFVFAVFIILCFIEKKYLVTSLTSLARFLSENNVVTVFILFPIFLIFIYVTWLILNILAARYYVKRKKIYDQMYSKEDFWDINRSRYAKVIIDNIPHIITSYKKIFNDYTVDKIGFFNNVLLYWNIFQYVMEEYYWKENIYDDLRKALFIRNISMATFILFLIVFFTGLFLFFSNLLSGKAVLGVFLKYGWIAWFLFGIEFTLESAYRAQVRFYLFKLFVTFNYMTSKIKKRKTILDYFIS